MTLYIGGSEVNSLLIDGTVMDDTSITDTTVLKREITMNDITLEMLTANASSSLNNINRDPGTLSVGNDVYVYVSLAIGRNASGTSASISGISGGSVASVGYIMVGTQTRAGHIQHSASDRFVVCTASKSSGDQLNLSAAAVGIRGGSLISSASLNNSNKNVSLSVKAGQVLLSVSSYNTNNCTVRSSSMAGYTDGTVLSMTKQAKPSGMMAEVEMMDIRQDGYVDISFSNNSNYSPSSYFFVLG